MLFDLYESLMAALPFLFVVGSLVFFHELGHYTAARFFGVKVESFSVGMGWSVASWRARSGTVWRIGILPMGGYVRIHGMDAGEAGIDPACSFSHKSLGRRSVIIAAGPFTNFLMAFMLFTGIAIGVGKMVPSLVVATAVETGPASVAGIHPGDLLLSIDGTRLTEFSQLQAIVGTAIGRPLHFAAKRGEQTLDFVVTPQHGEHDNHGIIGIYPESTYVPFNDSLVLSSIDEGFHQLLNLTSVEVMGIAHLITGKESISSLSGPLGIAVISNQAASAGVVPYLFFMALISINLGLANLLPIPILDGGYLAIYAIEFLKGRPLRQRTLSYALQGGVVVIVGFTIFSTWNDFNRIGFVHWMASLVSFGQ